MEILLGILVTVGFVGLSGGFVVAMVRLVEEQVTAIEARCDARRTEFEAFLAKVRYHATKSSLVLIVGAALLVLPAAMAPAEQRPVLDELIAQFRRAVFWQQIEVAKQIVALRDVSVLREFEPLLQSEDRHLRANAAFVFAGLGDPRGLETIKAILADRSYRPLGQGIPGGSFNTASPAWWLSRQILADRYYAVHVLGELRDERAIDLLLPLLGDGEVNYNVAWALGEIGDPRAIGPLIVALKDPVPLMRVSAIHALEKLKATEAILHLRTLLTDQALPSAGPQVPVAETARSAISTLERLRR